MAFGFDVVPGVLDLAVRADEVGDARDALEGTAHELLEAPGAVGLQHFVGGIAEQQKVELLLGFEARERFGRIGAGTKDDDSLFLEFRTCVAKLGRFDGSTGSVGFWKEEEEDALALKILQADELVLVGLEKEVGGFTAWL